MTPIDIPSFGRHPTALATNSCDLSITKFPTPRRINRLISLWTPKSYEVHREDLLKKLSPPLLLHSVVKYHGIHRVDNRHVTHYPCQVCPTKVPLLLMLQYLDERLDLPLRAVAQLCNKPSDTARYHHLYYCYR
jgi:hypothetical protein